MYNESQVFLPSASSSPNKDLKRTTNFHPSKFSRILYRIFEQSIPYGCLLFLVFSYSVYIGTLTTFDQHRETAEIYLYYTELSIVIYSAIEFLLRLYGSQSQLRYYGLEGIRLFIFERYFFIDMILLICYALVFFQFSFQYFNVKMILLLHSLRFLQLFRFISLDRHLRSIPLLGQSLWDYRRVLVATVFLCFVLLLPTAYLLWVVERLIPTDGKFFFETYADSLWFTINSMATIGYGDTWPQTLIGRALTATLCCIGVVLWTLPAGIISSSLTVMDEQRREHCRLQKPAAKFILYWWRAARMKNRSRNIRKHELDILQCKQFLAFLMLSQASKQFVRERYGMNYEINLQLKSDLHNLFQRLKNIEQKLDYLQSIDIA